MIRKLNRLRQRGQALLMMLMIFGVLGAYMAMQIFAGSNNSVQAVTDTGAALSQAQDALIGFAASTTPPHLPCPDRTAGPGANDGVEDRAGAACAVAEGNLPWVTLGIVGLDAWGHRFRYRVSTTAPTFTDNVTGIRASSVGNLTVSNETGAIATNVPVVIVSHGKNGWGATTSGGAVIALPPVTNTNERENTNGNTLFLAYAPADSSAAGGEFDDIVTWLTSATIFARMAQANKVLPP